MPKHLERQTAHRQAEYGDSKPQASMYADNCRVKANNTLFIFLLLRDIHKTSHLNRLYRLTSCGKPEHKVAFLITEENTIYTFPYIQNRKNLTMYLITEIYKIWKFDFWFCWILKIEIWNLKTEIWKWNTQNLKMREDLKIWHCLHEKKEY